MTMASNTDRLDITLPPTDAGETHVDFRISKIFLGDGQYYVNANIEILDGASHSLMQGRMLTVRAETPTLGTVAAEITARV